MDPLQSKQILIISQQQYLNKECQNVPPGKRSVSKRRYQHERSYIRFQGRSNRHSVENSSPRLRRFCVAWALSRGKVYHATHYTLRRNTESMMKI